jgi:hypothetical protein
MALPTPEEMAGTEAEGREPYLAAVRFVAAFEDLQGFRARVLELEQARGDNEARLVVLRERMGSARRRAIDAFRDLREAFTAKPEPQRAPK